MLRWLVEVKIDLTEEETDVATLEAKAAYLDTQIHKIKAKIKEKALDSLFDVLASLEAEQRETQQTLEQARIPKQNQLAHAQSLIAQLATTKDVTGLRRQIRQHSLC